MIDASPFPDLVTILIFLTQTFAFCSKQRQQGLDWGQIYNPRVPPAHREWRMEGRPGLREAGKLEMSDNSENETDN